MPLNILIINRNEALCGTISRFLDSEGHLASCCSGEKDQLNQALSERPDLIIIEVAMPELPAIELVNRLHRSTATRQIPVIVISDFPDLELEMLHIFDFIGKPVDLRRLREDISMLVSGAKKRGSAINIPSLTSEEHLIFHDFLIKHCGLHFEKRNIRVLERGLGSRMAALRIDSFGGYYDYLCKNMESRRELQKLLQLLTVGETYFFRYHAHFEALMRVVLPQLTGLAPKARIRIWSAGCSTGEEPYSIAMAIMESVPGWRSMDIRIIATDINSRALSLAKEGVYNAWKVRVTEKSYLDKYFTRIGESYVVRDEVKSLVEFSYFNLQNVPMTDAETFDAIFCRNVMIYFTTATTRKVVENFAVSLKKNGCLFLGHSETLVQVSSKFERHIHNGGFYFRKKPDQPEKAAAKLLTAVAATRTETAPAPAAASRKAAPVKELNAATLYGQGVSLLNEENFSEAAKIFEKLISLKPDHPGALLGMGQIHLYCGRVEAALICCNRALELDDLLHEGYYLRGLAFEVLEQEPWAIEEYRKAILLKMDFVMAHYQLGRLSFRRGNHKNGLRELKNSLKLLEKCDRETVVPFSRGLSREVFIGELRDEVNRIEAFIAREAA